MDKKYYKFINQHKIEQLKNKAIVVDNRIYSGDGIFKDETILKKAGYKELVSAEVPEYNPETHYLDKKYVDGDVITEVYEVLEIPTEDEVTEE